MAWKFEFGVRDFPSVSAEVRFRGSVIWGFSREGMLPKFCEVVVEVVVDVGILTIICV